MNIFQTHQQQNKKCPRSVNNSRTDHLFDIFGMLGSPKGPLTSLKHPSEGDITSLTSSTGTLVKKNVVQGILNRKMFLEENIVQKLRYRRYCTGKRCTGKVEQENIVQEMLYRNCCTTNTVQDNVVQKVLYREMSYMKCSTGKHVQGNVVQENVVRQMVSGKMYKYLHRQMFDRKMLYRIYCAGKDFTGTAVQENVV